MMKSIVTLCALSVIAVSTTAHAAVEKKSAESDSTMSIPAGSEGKTLESITVEGEDRVRVQFDRPPLSLDIDPGTAPGLDWDSMWAVLSTESFDFSGPLYERSAIERAGYAPRPWLNTFRDGPVARFRPNLSDVEQWSLEVADSRGRGVAKFEGSGKPPKEITWDGRSANGEPARTDLTYSYVLNAMDKAGNKRSFVGDAFEIPPHLDESRGDMQMTFAVPVDAASAPEALVTEAASRINELGDATKPVRVEVTAPSFAIAKAIADAIAADLRPLLRGEPSRVASTTSVDAGGAERASVTIRTGGATAAAAKKN